MKTDIINSATLLAKAYAFAKDGNASVAGKLLVQAAEDGNLDEVMDGVAQGVEALDEGFEDLPEDDEGMDDEGMDDEETLEASVQLPESVARLAARTMV